MTVLKWRHGKSMRQAIELMQRELAAEGYASQVQWQGPKFSASVGWGTVLSAEGHITDQEAVLSKCGGLARGELLTKVRQILERIFPGGEVA